MFGPSVIGGPLQPIPGMGAMIPSYPGVQGYTSPMVWYPPSTGPVYQPGYAPASAAHVMPMPGYPFAPTQPGYSYSPQQHQGFQYTPQHQQFGIPPQQLGAYSGSSPSHALPPGYAPSGPSAGQMYPSGNAPTNTGHGIHVQGYVDESSDKEPNNHGVALSETTVAVCESNREVSYQLFATENDDINDDGN